ncbi:MAG TPA: alpha/beta fold hydrolase [Streptomyces sp.]|uniref:thioesterase II family protein n=1 Tax=Streptomyces sp. TaxID=1931 RepID=UPI002D58AE41|nr:alpha/beta fold hydrolase [Streptomyces sp.]HZG07184.1 alpha/beta fold hydrolase [Streptomyces sp.]
MPRAHPWYLAFRPVEDARVTLYCLPCAGGGPSMFRTWADRLPGWIELRAVRLPGRQGRHREPAFTDADEATRALLDGLGPELDRPYAFFGHSMGALLAFRMVRELERTGGPLPRLLAAASWPPRGAAPSVMPDPADGDDAFAADLRRLGGIPGDLLDDPEMLRFTLPLLRADFSLCRSYVYRPAAPLGLPVLAVGGEDDAVTPPDTLATWEGETRDFLGLHLFPGGHFFLHEHVEELTGLVGKHLEAQDGS